MPSAIALRTTSCGWCSRIEHLDLDQGSRFTNVRRRIVPTGVMPRAAPSPVHRPRTRSRRRRPSRRVPAPSGRVPPSRPPGLPSPLRSKQRALHATERSARRGGTRGGRPAPARRRQRARGGAAAERRSQCRRRCAPRSAVHRRGACPPLRRGSCGVPRLSSGRSASPRRFRPRGPRPRVDERCRRVDQSVGVAACNDCGNEPDEDPHRHQRRRPRHGGARGDDPRPRRHDRRGGIHPCVAPRMLAARSLPILRGLAGRRRQRERGAIVLLRKQRLGPVRRTRGPRHGRDRRRRGGGEHELPRRWLLEHRARRPGRHQLRHRVRRDIGRRTRAERHPLPRHEHRHLFVRLGLREDARRRGRGVRRRRRGPPKDLEVIRPQELRLRCFFGTDAALGKGEHGCLQRVGFSPPPPAPGAPVVRGFRRSRKRAELHVVRLRTEMAAQFVRAQGSSLRVSRSRNGNVGDRDRPRRALPARARGARGRRLPAHPRAQWRTAKRAIPPPRTSAATPTTTAIIHGGRAADGSPAAPASYSASRAD